MVTGTILGVPYPSDLRVSPDGSKLYATHIGNFDAVQVIDTATGTTIATIYAGHGTYNLAVNPDGSKVYVADLYGGVAVVDTATNTWTATIGGLSDPWGLAVTPDGSKLYVANAGGNSVSVADTATNTVTTTIPVGSGPQGVAVTPDGSEVYVANYNDNTVSAIATATNTVTATVGVGNGPTAHGIFIQSLPNFAGTPGFSNCQGQSVAALAKKFGGIDAAAAALGYPSVKALQNAIKAFCRA
jgi:YVTN family beta-propeller protein